MVMRIRIVESIRNPTSSRSDIGRFNDASTVPISHTV